MVSGMVTGMVGLVMGGGRDTVAGNEARRQSW
jgi:hypothetical protein